MAEKRKLFEEVDVTAPREAAIGVIDQGRGKGRGALRVWLIVIFVMVWAMVAVGGLTRLTDSGLSITEWRPLTGAIPPLNQADWESEFAKYQQIDEWRLQNNWMSLADFKVIYWWEWGHRQLGRAIGLVWALGFVWFVGRGLCPAGWWKRLLLLGALGGAQGAIGAWMVQSGITQGEDVVDVASYRLALHLGLAFVIMGLTTWYVLLLSRPERVLLQARRDKDAKLFSISTGLMHFCFLQILLGALVAGIDAGRSYTDWPLMGGRIFPESALYLDPLWRNFFESPGLVQFIHRVSGYLLAAFAVVVWLRARKSAHPKTRNAFTAMIAVMALQIALGIVTVVNAVPWYLGLAHQLAALLLWVLVLRGRFLAAYPVATALRAG